MVGWGVSKAHGQECVGQGGTLAKVHYGCGVAPDSWCHATSKYWTWRYLDAVWHLTPRPILWACCSHLRAVHLLKGHLQGRVARQAGARPSRALTLRRRLPAGTGSCAPSALPPPRAPDMEGSRPLHQPLYPAPHSSITQCRSRHHPPAGPCRSRTPGPPPKRRGAA